VREGVDPAHESLGCVVDGFDRGFGEDGSVAARDAEAVLQVSAGGVAVEACEAVADGDALGQGLQVGHAELLAEPGLPGEEEREASDAVEVEIREHGEEAQHVGPQGVRLVHDEQDGQVALAGEPGPAIEMLRVRRAGAADV